MREQVQVRVEDICETLAGEWLSAHRIQREYENRFGPVRVESVKKAMWRLVRSSGSALESRHVKLDDGEGMRLEVRFPWAVRVSHRVN